MFVVRKHFVSHVRAGARARLNQKSGAYVDDDSDYDYDDNSDNNNGNVNDWQRLSINEAV